MSEILEATRSLVLPWKVFARGGLTSAQRYALQNSKGTNEKKGRVITHVHTQNLAKQQVGL